MSMIDIDILLLITEDINTEIEPVAQRVYKLDIDQLLDHTTSDF